MAEVERKLSESEQKLVKANERNHNQQKAHMEALQNKKLIEKMLKQENEELREELKKEKKLRHDQHKNNGNDPVESSNPCSFLWSWISQSNNSESNLNRKIRWDQGNLLCKISSMLHTVK